MILRLAFKTLLLATALSAFWCTALAGPQTRPAQVAQQYAPTVPVTQLLENEAAAVQGPLTNNAATESGRQANLAAEPRNPARTALILVSLGVFLLLILARRLAGLVPRRLYRGYEPSSATEEHVAEQTAFEDFAAAFKVGPGAKPAATVSAPVSAQPVTTWDLSAEAASVQSAGSLPTRPAAAPAPASASAAPVLDENQKAEQRLNFAAAASYELGRLGRLLDGIAARADVEGRRELLMEVCSQVGAFKDLANSPEVMPAWQMAAALDGLMKQLAGRPGRATSSSLHTAAAGLELLKELCVPGVRPGLTTNPPARFLAVDDDTICRHAVATALKKAFTNPELAADGATALALTERERFDVIFLDIEMPGMDGFELCARIRKTAQNEKTPVVFVTSHSDFDSRLNSTLSGAQDLIAKPFLSFEIALKALTLLLRGRLAAERPQSAAQPPQPGMATVAQEFGMKEMEKRRLHPVACAVLNP